MIEFKTGDILKADAEALVNTVNCVGVMGRGIALAVQEGLSRELQGLRARLRAGRGAARPDVRLRDRAPRESAYIINFPTKRHWRGKSRIEDIDAGLAALVAEIR